MRVKKIYFNVKCKKKMVVLITLTSRLFLAAKIYLCLVEWKHCLEIKHVYPARYYNKQRQCIVYLRTLNPTTYLLTYVTYKMCHQIQIDNITFKLPFWTHVLTYNKCDHIFFDVCKKNKN